MQAPAIPQQHARQYDQRLKLALLLRRFPAKALPADVAKQFVQDMRALDEVPRCAVHGQLIGTGLPDKAAAALSKQVGAAPQMHHGMHAG
jgi:methyl coenzyme M reductase subunit D